MCGYQFKSLQNATSRYDVLVQKPGYAAAHTLNFALESPKNLSPLEAISLVICAKFCGQRVSHSHKNINNDFADRQTIRKTE